MMKQTLILQIPDEIHQVLKEEATKAGKSLEQIALECIAQHTERPQRGSVDALRPFFGAWSMTSEERAQIEQMIDKERLLEENKGFLAVSCG